MAHPQTPERVEEVRRALRRLLELLAHEVAQELVAESTQVASGDNPGTSSSGSGGSLDSDSIGSKP